MKKQVYEINEKGMLIKILIAEIDGNGNPLEDLGENIVITDPPNGLYRAKWNGVDWIEDMTQDEIDAINNQPREPTTEEILLVALQEIQALKNKVTELEVGL